MNRTVQNCPDIGVWRSWLDHEGDQPDAPFAALAEHLPGCPACQRLVADLREDADDVHEALSVIAPTRLPSPAEVAAARERLDWRQRRAASPVTRIPTRSQPIPMFSRISTPWRVAGSAVAAALVISMLVAFTPEGSTVASAFLAQFRSQQVTVIEITPQTQSDIVKTLNALGNLGKVQTPSATRPEAAVRAAEGQQKTVTLAEAAQSVGFKLATPDPAIIPAGMSPTPQVHVMPSTQVRFTFDKAKARQYLQSSGHPEVNLPDKFDGASLVVTIPAAAVLEYGTPSAGKEGLIVGQAGEVTVDAEGVSLDEMRTFLLGLPGLPPTVVNQLRQIQNWTETLPLPVPVNQVQWQQKTVNGTQYLLLNDNSGALSAVIWHSNGHLMGAAGSLKANDLMRVVESLH